jgi:hypothetical protein
MIVLAGGVDDEVGLEFIQNGEDDPIEGYQKSLIRRAGRERDVDGCPEGKPVPG